MWSWVVSVTPRPRFTPGERTPGTHCTGRWVGPRTGLDTDTKGKISCLCRGSNLDRPVVQSVARHYTDWPTRLQPTCVVKLNMFYAKLGGWSRVQPKQQLAAEHPAVHCVAEQCALSPGAQVPGLANITSSPCWHCVNAARPWISLIVSLV
jgi:hypothetical protein